MVGVRIHNFVVLKSTTDMSIFAGLHRSVPAEFARVQERDWATEVGDIVDGQPPVNTQRRKC